MKKNLIKMMLVAVVVIASGAKTKESGFAQRLKNLLMIDCYNLESP